MRIALEKKTDIETKTHISYVIGDIEENCEFVDPANVKISEIEDSYERKTACEIVRMMAMFSNFKTRAELMACAAKRKDFFTLRMAEMYAILKGMK